MDRGIQEVHFATPIPMDRLESFCKNWNLSRLELFGSVLRDDFGPGSDVDVLITFKEGHKPTLLNMLAMKDELELLFDRRVDLVRRGLIEESPNVYRRSSILESATVIYAD